MQPARAAFGFSPRAAARVFSRDGNHQRRASCPWGRARAKSARSARAVPIAERSPLGLHCLRRPFSRLIVALNIRRVRLRFRAKHEHRHQLLRAGRSSGNGLQALASAASLDYSLCKVSARQSAEACAEQRGNKIGIQYVARRPHGWTIAFRSTNKNPAQAGLSSRT
jgi:hypothetical protein